MVKIAEQQERAVSVQKAKVKITEYAEKMFVNGFFNPICPGGYNFITGRTEDTIPPNHGIKEYTITARLNGTATYKN